MQNKPNLSFWQIWNMSFGFLGIQFGWGLQMANMSPIYKYLGAEENQLPYLWLAGPITGLIIQPIVGAMSDRTWGKFGRRRPYFTVGAIIASIALLLMPNSSAVWMAAGLLWILDASINITMEPFRAFVGDKLNEQQRTLGFVMQSFFIGIGQTLANMLPFILTALGVTGIMASGIPNSTFWSFIIGGMVFGAAVLWTVSRTDEYPPDNMLEFEAKRKEAGSFGGLLSVVFREIGDALREMPATMRQLAVVQFFTWFGLPCMWQYYGLAIARNVFGAVSDDMPAFKEGTEWGGVCFAVYNAVCFVIAFLLPQLAKKIGRKATHMLCLGAGGLGLLTTTLATDRYFLWIGMAGIGIAWASILSMPYVMLSSAVPAKRMGVYMGVFNLFIVLPQIVMSFLIPKIYKNLLGDNPLNVVLLGGVSLLIAALSVVIVREPSDKTQTS